ncbi:hypothetical protein PAAG_11469 [Paracoccidioides lutzii Pb01]|uniref:Uncharacterized protein n=1 Tax=Paracoccidioides lutzii (strain ATCC MYA-826 / Pb01) TaxID=502779 RepID=A0A0A2V1V3_PARBA|nr:hypothetical protein PAAG_11469 [Paracoccidioides lutzii Pb01]KGQ01751.1 hypothetical protein PAAG_11469 [Paracoccidioides lutzii Pb01]
MLNADLGNSQYQGNGASTMAFTALSVQEARHGNKRNSIKYLDAALQSLSRRRKERLLCDTNTHYAFAAAHVS